METILSTCPCIHIQGLDFDRYEGLQDVVEGQWDKFKTSIENPQHLIVIAVTRGIGIWLKQKHNHMFPVNLRYHSQTHELKISVRENLPYRVEQELVELLNCLTVFKLNITVIKPKYSHLESIAKRTDRKE